MPCFLQYVQSPAEVMQVNSDLQEGNVQINTLDLQRRCMQPVEEKCMVIPINNNTLV